MNLNDWLFFETQQKLREFFDIRNNSNITNSFTEDMNCRLIFFYSFCVSISNLNSHPQTDKIGCYDWWYDTNECFRSIMTWNIEILILKYCSSDSLFVLHFFNFNKNFKFCPRTCCTISRMFLSVFYIFLYFSLLVFNIEFSLKIWSNLKTSKLMSKNFILHLCLFF